MIWSKKQVKNLKKRQKANYLHSYTCKCGKDLIPTVDGWKCNCGYTQNWAHESDLNGEFKKFTLL